MTPPRHGRSKPPKPARIGRVDRLLSEQAGVTGEKIAKAITQVLCQPGNTCVTGCTSTAAHAQARADAATARRIGDGK